MRRASQPILIALRGLDPVGTGRQVELLSRGLAAGGRDVHVAVTSAGGGVGSRLRGAGLPVHVIGRRASADAAATLRLVGLARRLGAGVLVSFGRRQAAMAAVVRQAAPWLRTVAHAAVPADRGWSRHALCRADAVVAPAEEIAASCRRGGVAAARLATVPPGIEVDRGTGLSRAEVAERLGLDAGREWTLAVAPLVAASRLDRLLWGIDQLGVVRRDMQHVLVGSGPLLGRLSRRARLQEIAGRLFVRPHCDVLPDLVGHVRYVWQPGRTPFGGVILDAMARGVPAVAVASHAARQLIVSGETGWVVPPFPESEFPRRAFTLLERPAEAASFGEAARRRAAEAFPAEAMVAGFAAVIDGLAG